MCSQCSLVVPDASCQCLSDMTTTSVSVLLSDGCADDFILLCCRIVNVAHGLDALAGDFEGLLDDSIRHGEADLFGPRDAICLFGVSVGRALGPAADGERLLADVVEHPAHQGGECGDLAGAEQGQGVVLYEGRPVGRVRVEGVEERFLDFGDVALTQERSVDLRSQIRVKRGECVAGRRVRHLDGR
jgi:hypothetical protein